MPNDNTIYACGSNEEGQLGVNNNSDYSSYIKLDLNDLKKKIIQIAPGRSHTIM